MQARPAVGHGPQRYLARAVSLDGCVKQFDVLERSEALARLRLERFLKKHWKGYSVVEIEPVEDMPKRRRASK